MFCPKLRFAHVFLRGRIMQIGEIGSVMKPISDRSIPGSHTKLTA